MSKSRERLSLAELAELLEDLADSDRVYGGR
jgi:hypothetical protein